MNGADTPPRCGVASLVLGITPWSQWPASGIRVIGRFAGIDLLVDGWWPSLARSARRLTSAPA